MCQIYKKSKVRSGGVECNHSDNMFSLSFTSCKLLEYFSIGVFYSVKPLKSPLFI